MPQTINGLMRHLRDDCGISINGSAQKKQLISYGYYHGYKGYRFYKTRSNVIPFTDYSELIAVNDYDNNLKSILYPHLMFLETALKSIVTNEAVSGMKSAAFESIYTHRMNDDAANTRLRIRRLHLRDKIYSTLSNHYANENEMIRHFYDKGNDMPIWAVFEIVTLGDFANFVSCLNENIREAILVSMDMFDITVDTKRLMLSNSLYTLKSLRNAIAHNAIIFDGRFSDRGANSNIKRWLSKETGIASLTFSTPIDYIILLCCLLKRIDSSNLRGKQLIEGFDKTNTELSLVVPPRIFSKIIHSGDASKIVSLRTYLGI